MFHNSSIMTSIAMLLPAGRVKNWILRRIGHAVDPNARIGPCLVLRVERIELEAGASIGMFNAIRDVKLVRCERGSGIGQFNWIGGARPLIERGGSGSFILQEGASFTSRHYVDCSGGVNIGRFAAVAGVRSTFLTHAIDTKEARQSYDGISIGDYSLVSSNTCLTPGAVVPPRSLVGMGSVVTARALRESDSFYSGVPAVRKRESKGKYFTRSTRSVDLPDPSP